MNKLYHDVLIQLLKLLMNEYSSILLYKILKMNFYVIFCIVLDYEFYIMLLLGILELLIARSVIVIVVKAIPPCKNV